MAKRTEDPSRLVMRKCRVCEWQGETIERPGVDVDCPWCHAPTDCIPVVAPDAVSPKREKNPHAAALGRLGGSKGGRARAAALTPQQRRSIAAKAAKARWQDRKRGKT